jgi:hypothetical protein
MLALSPRWSRGAHRLVVGQGASLRRKGALGPAHGDGAGVRRLGTSGVAED